ncbi:MAG: tetratricopeptide repeat protein [Sandaracinaceae bacterium]|nr:tetratricopeptide repeat protein [Sandaracinaceae bacterium]
MAASSTRTDPDPLVGTTIDGAYEIVGVIGGGGAGVVYEARQRRVGRAVAVKVLRPNFAANAQEIKRFKREALAIGRLGHPSIVELYDVGRLADGRPYLVMPRLRGKDLGRLLREGGRMSASRVVELLAGPAAALDLVHHAGMLHRDVKPANLILETLADGQELVKLVDFGHASLLDPAAPRLTREGYAVGTAWYLAPEVASGERADRRADVYSLACTMFELLAGEVPIDAPAPLDLLVKKTQRDAPRLEALGVAVPPGVGEAIARGLARAPEDRQPSAGALLGDVRRALGMDAPRAPVAIGAQPSVIVAEDARPGRRSPQRALATEVDRPAVAGALGAREPATREGAHGGPAPEAQQSAAQQSAAQQSEAIELPLTRTPRRALVALAVAGLAAVLAIAGWRAWPPEPPAPQDGGAPTEPPAPMPALGEPAAAAGAQETLLGAIEDGVALGLDYDPREPGAARGRRAALASVAHGPLPGSPEGLAHVAPEDGDGAAALTRQGLQALVEGRVPAAIRRFEAATAIAPDHAPAWRGLGVAHQRVGRTAEARRAFERYLALAPDAPDAAAIRERMGAR